MPFTLLYATQSSSTSSTSNLSLQRMKGCVCLVTGASRGIGKGIAVALGREGAIVYVTGTSSFNTTTSTEPYATNDQVGGPGTIETTALKVTAAGGLGIPVWCNHANDTHVQAVMDRIQREYGYLDVLVNNVFRIPPGGPAQLQQPFWQQGLAAWDTIHTIGLRSHYVATCMAFSLLQRAQSTQRPHPSPMSRPLIVMVSSFGALTYTFNVPYGVGKAGVDRLVKDMAVELAPAHDMTICSVWPGVVLTERTQATVETGEWEQLNLPLEFAESPEFTGRAIVALATDPNNRERSGRAHVVAELAEEYGFTDVSGTRPPSIRSLQFLLPSYAFSPEQRKRIPSWLIPNWKLPLWVMAQGQPPRKPQE
jgi:dehydrogenase/reductase SDR family member 1